MRMRHKYIPLVVLSSFLLILYKLLYTRLISGDVGVDFGLLYRGVANVNSSVGRLRTSCEFMQQKMPQVERSKRFKIPNCPLTSGEYEHGITSGSLKENLTDPEKLSFPSVEHGGHWHPNECRPTDGSSLVIVPIRNRRNHLSLFLTNMHPFLQQQRISYSILVVNQLGNEPFNRATMFNVGYLASRHLNYDCFVFTDVDMIPDRYENMYTCNPNLPKHISSAVSTFNYSLPYKTNFGGIVGFTKKQFERINGYSNLYWGWGGEDDDLYDRTFRKFHRIDRSPSGVGRITHFAHNINESAPRNPIRVQILKTKRDYSKDGLNDVQKYCSCVDWHELGLYSQIDVRCRAVSEQEILGKL